MTPRRSLLAYPALLGLVGAAIVHIAMLLALPHFADRDAWSRLAAAGPTFGFVSLDAAVGRADPLVDAHACRFDLSDGAARVTAGAGVPFWSVSVYNRRGHNSYGFTDRTVATGKLDLVLVTPAQMIELRKAMPEALAGSVFVEIGDPVGIVVLRAFRPDDSWGPAVETFFRGARCQPA